MLILSIGPSCERLMVGDCNDFPLRADLLRMDGRISILVILVNPGVDPQSQSTKQWQTAF